MSGSSAALLIADRFTILCIRLVRQEAALEQCVLLSTSKKVRIEMKDRLVSDVGDQWFVMLDIVILGVLWMLRGVPGRHPSEFFLVYSLWQLCH